MKRNTLIFEIISWQNDINDAVIKGKITCMLTNDPLPFCKLRISGLEVNTTATTDYNGEFSTSLRQGGFYNLDVTYVGYERLVIDSVYIKTGHINQIVLQLTLTGFCKKHRTTAPMPDRADNAENKLWWYYESPPNLDKRKDNVKKNNT